MDILLLILLILALLAGLVALGFGVYFVLTRRPLAWGRDPVWLLGEWSPLYSLTTALERLGHSYEATPDSITLRSALAEIRWVEGPAGTARFWIEPTDEEFEKSIVAELRTLYRCDEARLGFLEAAGAAAMLIFGLMGSARRRRSWL